MKTPAQLNHEIAAIQGDLMLLESSLGEVEYDLENEPKNTERQSQKASLVANINRHKDRIESKARALTAAAQQNTAAKEVERVDTLQKLGRDAVAVAKDIEVSARRLDKVIESFVAEASAMHASQDNLRRIAQQLRVPTEATRHLTELSVVGDVAAYRMACAKIDRMLGPLVVADRPMSQGRSVSEFSGRNVDNTLAWVADAVAKAGA